MCKHLQVLGRSQRRPREEGRLVLAIVQSADIVATAVQSDEPATVPRILSTTKSK